MNTFYKKTLDLYQQIQTPQDLPEGIKILNPFIENEETLRVMHAFYEKFYNDQDQRKLILGINPSRHGAAITGIPFTDTKRLESECDISIKGVQTHEVSSVFYYDLIKAYGGVEYFYKDFYINSPCPLAIVREKANGNWVNINYYDDKALFESMKPFMIEQLAYYSAMNIDHKNVFVLGKKNAQFIKKLNAEHQFFENFTVLEHPRYIQQYKFHERDDYILKFLKLLS